MSNLTLTPQLYVRIQKAIIRGLIGTFTGDEKSNSRRIFYQFHQSHLRRCDVLRLCEVLWHPRTNLLSRDERIIIGAL